ncbi:MAG: hypothetical protein J6J36_06715 [Clostridia bacterium]|nr:hypothetical protein [Clostridia bacterium]
MFDRKFYDIDGNEITEEEMDEKFYYFKKELFEHYGSDDEFWEFIKEYLEITHKDEKVYYYKYRVVIENNENGKEKTELFETLAKAYEYIEVNKTENEIARIVDLRNETTIQVVR